MQIMDRSFIVVLKEGTEAAEEKFVVKILDQKSYLYPETNQTDYEKISFAPTFTDAASTVGSNR
jgi:hypothetical protein